jgi:DNA polymerase III sliding clamp (beta) subunit (PCNA family)
MAKYPNFFPVLSREESSVSITLPDEVKEAVNIAQQIPGKTEDSQMKLILSKHKLSLAYNTINGWFKRNIRIDYGGQPITFSMNVNVLNDALRNIGNELLMSTEGTGMMKLGSFNFVFPLEIEES